MPVLRRNSSPQVVRILVFINLVVFGCWHLLPDKRFMAANFIVSWTHLEHGRWWVLLTAAFSHTMLFHLLINMVVLISFGRPLAMLMGTRRFLGFYLFAAVFSSFTHAATSKYLLGMPDEGAVGASGAVAGLLLLFSLAFPKEKLLFFGVIPVPAIIGALLFIGLDLWGLSAQAHGGGLPIGHGAHLGGAFVGIVYFVYLKFLRPKRPAHYPERV
ncbi:MAG: rhomboid family intramembrane serine protease [Bdellovibrionales bacterium]|nr:rhomboid family intramembrane serine protease [Bdellovibrionales bacterium]